MAIEREGAVCVKRDTWGRIGPEGFASVFFAKMFEVSLMSLLTPLMMLKVFPLDGVPAGDGRSVAVAEELSNVESLGIVLVFSPASSAPTLRTLKPWLSAPTTALTTTAGAGAPVPGSCQFAATAPERDRLCPYGLDDLGLLPLRGLALDL